MSHLIQTARGTGWFGMDVVTHAGLLPVLGSGVGACLRQVEMALRMAPPNGERAIRVAAVPSVGTPAPSCSPQGRVPPPWWSLPVTREPLASSVATVA